MAAGTVCKTVGPSGPWEFKSLGWDFVEGIGGSPNWWGTPLEAERPKGHTGSIPVPSVGGFGHAGKPARLEPE